MPIPDGFFDLGGVAGVAALTWQVVEKVRAHGSRPILRVEPFDPTIDLQTWVLGGQPPQQRKFLTLEVTNDGESTATMVSATMKVVRSSPARARQQRSFGLHWAGIDYSLQNSGAQPVDIPPGDSRRIDIVFTVEGFAPGGGWVAIPMALAAPGFHQAYLPPGEYETTVRITAHHALPVERFIKITVSDKWESLAAVVR